MDGEIETRQENYTNSLYRMEDNLERLVTSFKTVQAKQKSLIELSKAIYTPEFYNGLTPEQQEYIVKYVPKV